MIGRQASIEAQRLEDEWMRLRKAWAALVIGLDSDTQNQYERQLWLEMSQRMGKSIETLDECLRLARQMLNEGLKERDDFV